MAITVTGTAAFNEALRMYLKKVSAPRQKTQILAAGGAQVRREASKSPTPKSQRNHYYYAKNRKVLIYSGNLRRSMKVFRGKEGDVYVGPRVLRRITGGEIGQTPKTSSGYYAAALYGLAASFRQRIMEPALGRAQSRAVQAIEKVFSRWHETNKPK